MIDELTLELVDLSVGPLPLLLGGESLDPLHEHAPVPAPIEDRDAAGPGQLSPESPEVMASLFFVRRSGHLDHLVVASVQGARQHAARPTLARRVPPLQDDNRGPPHPFRGALQAIQSPLQLLLASLVLGLGESPCEVQARQHRGRWLRSVLGAGLRFLRIDAGRGDPHRLAPLQLSLDALGHHLADLERSVVGVGGFDDRPLGVSPRGRDDQVLTGTSELVVHVEMAPVLLGQPPGLQRVLL